MKKSHTKPQSRKERKSVTAFSSFAPLRLCVSHSSHLSFPNSIAGKGFMILHEGTKARRHEGDEAETFCVSFRCRSIAGQFGNALFPASSSRTDGLCALGVSQKNPTFHLPFLRAFVPSCLRVKYIRVVLWIGFAVFCLPGCSVEKKIAPVCNPMPSIWAGIVDKIADLESRQATIQEWDQAAESAHVIKDGQELIQFVNLRGFSSSERFLSTENFRKASVVKHYGFGCNFSALVFFGNNKRPICVIKG